MKSKYRKMGAVSMAAALTLLAVSLPYAAEQAGSAHAGINAVLAEYLSPKAVEKGKSEKNKSEKNKSEVSDIVSKSSKSDSDKQKKQDKKQKAEKICGYTNPGIANVDQYVNIRAAAGESAAVVGKLPAEAGCEILDTLDGWYHIRSGAVNGYVKSEYLITGEQARKLAADLKKNVATVKAQTVYIREKPAADCAILTMVTAGEELEIAGEDAAGKTESGQADTAKKENNLYPEWIQIRLDDEVGYVSTKYVTISEELKKAMAYTESGADGISDARYNLVQTALSYVGGHYAAGGSVLSEGVDSAGFTMQLLAQHAVYLPHSARRQAGYGTGIDTSELLPGDLIFYGIGNTISHVAVYIGNGQIVHASNSRDGIKISDMFYRTPICCKRVLS